MLREGKPPAQGHTARKCLSWDLNLAKYEAKCSHSCISPPFYLKLGVVPSGFVLLQVKYSHFLQQFSM